MKSRAPRRLSRRSFTAAASRFAALLALGGLATCDNVDNFEVDVSGKGTIAKGNLIDELLSSLNLDELQSIDLTNELKNQGVTKEDVDSVRLVRFTLSIEGPPGATFDFIDSLTFYIETGGAPKAMIARLPAVPAGATELTLEVEQDVELKPYVVAPSMKITSEVTGTRPDQDTTVRADLTLDVDVTVPGC
jgi:hypothetical protein